MISSITSKLKLNTKLVVSFKMYMTSFFAGYTVSIGTSSGCFPWCPPTIHTDRDQQTFSFMSIIVPTIIPVITWVNIHSSYQGLEIHFTCSADRISTLTQGSSVFSWMVHNAEWLCQAFSIHTCTHSLLQ